MTERKEIYWVCDECGIEANRLTCLKKFGKEPQKKKFDVSCYHVGICEVCNKEKEVTEVRDFWFPDFSLLEEKTSFIAKVYIAGPLYASGDPETNIQNAIETADKLVDLGYAPFVPHLNHYWHQKFPRPNDFWMDLDFEFLKYFDVLLRLPGVSRGADNEVAFMLAARKPVFNTIKELDIYYKRTK